MYICADVILLIYKYRSIEYYFNWVVDTAALLWFWCGIYLFFSQFFSKYLWLLLFHKSYSIPHSSFEMRKEFFVDFIWAFLLDKFSSALNFHAGLNISIWKELFSGLDRQKSPILSAAMKCIPTLRVTLLLYSATALHQQSATALHQ